MEVIAVFVIAAQVAVAVAIVVFVVICVWFACRAFARARYGLGGVLIVGALLPFLIFGANRLRAERSETDRLAEVAAFKRLPFSAQRPKTLEVRGYLGSDLAASLVNTGEFERVYQIQQPTRLRQPLSTDVFFPRRSADCIAKSRWFMRKAVEGDRDQGDRLPKACIGISSDRYTLSELPRDAVVVMLDHEATLYPGNTTWSNGAFEVREREGGKFTLIEYREVPHVMEAKSPLSIEKRSRTPKLDLDIYKLLLATLGWKPEPDPLF